MRIINVTSRQLASTFTASIVAATTLAELQQIDREIGRRGAQGLFLFGVESKLDQLLWEKERAIEMDILSGIEARINTRYQGTNNLFNDIEMLVSLMNKYTFGFSAMTDKIRLVDEKMNRYLTRMAD